MEAEPAEKHDDAAGVHREPAATGEADEPGDTPSSRIGQTVDGRYAITELIGEGGMGSVYRAEHSTIRRPVAIKFLNSELRQFPETNARLRREAFAAGRLTHPNCVGVNDCGSLSDGSVYLVMEFVEGRTLERAIREAGRLDVARALRITRHVLRGLAHAHGLDVVHRDIKPENVVLVSHDGDPDFAKILDFGIAKLLGEAVEEAGGEALTRAGFALGTPTYMSPEQVSAASVDGRTDLYSVSVMLYEMIAGRPPFLGEDMVAIATQHVLKEPPTFREVDPLLSVPQDVEQLVRDGLRKDVEERTKKAEEFLQRIDDCLVALAGEDGARRQPTQIMDVTQGASPSAGQADLSSVPARLVSGVVTRARNVTARWNRKQLAGVGVVVATFAVLLALFAGPTHEEELNRAIAQLEDGKKCQERRKAVATLKALGDEKAIPALKKARRRMYGGILGIGKKNANACLRKDANAAIKHLEN